MEPDPVLGPPLYLDTSAVLRATLEGGTSPEIERRIGSARILVSSRLSVVESSRALIRLRALGLAGEARIADAERALAAIWARCEVWEVSRRVCDLACVVAPRRALRAPDAIHLATFVLARRELEGLDLLTADERLQAAAMEAVDIGA
ncbi:MAG TPA: type II toxin-antitoxin system VapC family toxin [Candidatus Binatia bacterium]|nr:type II toxin-antitoxin system VapC family toxin [Candidatus Binatia bacterium]